TEWGDPGPKYHAFREVIARHAPVPDEPVPAAGRRLPPTPVELDRRAALLPYATASVAAVRGQDPLPMHALGQASGLALYRTAVPAAGDGLLRFTGGVGDRAQVFVDGAPAGVLERERNEETLPVRVPRPGATLDVLVENLGGVNYGPHLGDPKGLLGPVSLDGTVLRGWECRPLPHGVPGPAAFEALGAGPAAAPAYHHGAFEVTEPADAFLALPGWTKGQAWVNGFALGRYWNRGPQRTLYVPAPVLRPGTNDLVLLELHGGVAGRALLTDAPDLGPDKA
ncbi:beta-galactosidase, partial [Streptomyces sp. TRM76130]|nr:beta-galactosidase [Streptomyces sp. TRM76130]